MVVEAVHVSLECSRTKSKGKPKILTRGDELIASGLLKAMALSHRTGPA